ncbi:MAG: Fic family protein [Mycoplasmataceae bacterium]|jgi:Fic family protein|nr:Fic family protein [Mycoplasmataceae bacterium]
MGNLLFSSDGKLDKTSKLYRLLREDFTYHSSKIEGSTLTKEEHITLAALNFKETDIESIKKLFPNTDIRKQNDAIENIGCIKLFDYVVENYTKPLTHEEIQKYQGILKKDSKLEEVSPEQVGKYRIEDVIVKNSTFDSAPSRLVYQKMDSLLKNYEVRKINSLHDIAEFHCEFETIHPFRDGNGRVGRMIMFKQCFQTDIHPFIIDDISRNQYLNSLELYNTHHTCKYLLECFEELQNVFKEKYSKYLSK